MNKINKKTIIGITIIILIIISYYTYTKKDDYVSSNFEIHTLNTFAENQVEEKQDNKIKVHIAGAVKNAGLYEMNENSRISDAIEIAGGVTEEADISNINLASKIEDEMKIYVPTIKEKVDSTTEINALASTEKTENINKDAKGGKININNASQTELESLPGIGPSIALKIINYREENGKFNNIEDIKNVKGIGDAKYEQIKNLIRV